MQFVDDRELGRRVRELRTGASVSQAQLGEVLGIGQTGVSKVETGARTLSAREMLVLGEFFNIPVSRLVGDASNPRVSLRAADAGEPEVQESLRIFHACIDDYFGLQALIG